MQLMIPDEDRLGPKKLVKHPTKRFGETPQELHFSMKKESEQDKYNDPIDRSPITNEELRGWYSYGVAADGYSSFIASFLPIVLKDLAANSAVERTNRSMKCDTSGTYYCDVQLFGMYIDTSSLVLYATSISVLCQFILFASLGSLADFGSHRKQFMIGFGMFSAILGFGFSFVVNSSLWWLAYLLYILSNIVYGASFVFYYAWVPVLTRAHPDVLKADADPDVSDEEYYSISDRIANDISSKGFYWGYITAVIQLILASAFVVFTGAFFVQREFLFVYPMQISISVLCVWQFVILLTHTNRLMKTRPGPPLPEGTNYFAFSLRNLYNTLKQAPKLTELGASTLILLGSSVIVPLFAAFGNWLWHIIQFKLGWSTKKTLMIQAALYCFLPIYGLAGFFVSKGTPFGLNNVYEVPILGAFHGFLLGATQSSCRVMFSEMIPHGHESEFFGLYEITDKGSSWIGPLVVGAITNATGSIRWSFLFLLTFFCAPLFIFGYMDVSKGKKQAKEFIAKENRHSVHHL
jgi:UMF1 family MFS transporter